MWETLAASKVNVQSSMKHESAGLPQQYQDEYMNRGQHQDGSTKKVPRTEAALIRRRADRCPVQATA